MRKHAYQYKNRVLIYICAIQRNKRDILQEIQAEKNCHNGKKDLSI